MTDTASTSSAAAPSASDDSQHQHDDDDDQPNILPTAPTATRQSCLSLLRNALRNRDQLTAMISNYSTSYNAVNVGIVLPVLNYSLESKSKGDGAYSSPSYAESTFIPESTLSISRRLDDNNNNNEESDEQDSIVASSLLAGMIVGQLIGGFLGDVLGRRNAMMLVMILQIGGSLGSALFISTDNEVEGLTTLEQLAIWRFILGIGAGGVYPLAAVMSAENKEEGGMAEEEVISVNGMGDIPQTNDVTNNDQIWNDEEEINHAGNERHSTNGAGPSSNDATANSNSAEVSSFQRISLTFSTQGLGFITVPLLAYPMLELGWNADAIWRVLLGVGAIPGFIVLYLRLCSGNTKGRKGYDKATTSLPDSTGNMIRTNGVPQNNSSHKNKAGAFELPSSNCTNGTGNATGGSSPTLQAAVSTLFFNDVTSSDSNNDDSLNENNNEMALVENSHLEGDHDGVERITGTEFGAHTNSPRAPNVNHSRGLWESIRAEPNLGRKFAGTAGTWFLFDVTFYGNTLFEPLVLEAAFGSHSANATDGYELLETTVRDSLVISLLSLPGYFVTVFMIGRRTCMCRSIRSSSSSTRCGSASCFPCTQTPSYIQMQGFFVMFLLYIIIGLFWASLSNIQWLLVVLYAGTFFFANYGPNATTFLLPSVTYSEECRSTLNGLSAAAGKLGALLGASVFAPAADMLGESVVMVFCGCVSLVALMLTKICLGGGTVRC